jgi:hypothetical protein
MDRELANIVLVRKRDMEKWLARQDKLQYDLASTKRKVDAKLADCRHRYDVQFQELKRQKEADITDLKQRYKDLEFQKDKQEVQNVDAK